MKTPPSLLTMLMVMTLSVPSQADDDEWFKIVQDVQEHRTFEVDGHVTSGNHSYGVGDVIFSKDLKNNCTIYSSANPDWGKIYLHCFNSNDNSDHLGTTISCSVNREDSQSKIVTFRNMTVELECRSFWVRKIW